MGSEKMKYTTPKTFNFAKTGDVWVLTPPLGSKYEIQGVTMTFDKRIKDEFDFFVRFFDGGSNLLQEKVYSSMLDWVLNATEHTEIKGLLDQDLHQIYMNFSAKPILSANHIARMEVGPLDGEKLTDKNGDDIMVALGEYIISEDKIK